MNILQVYPTSRALRAVMQTRSQEDGFIPTLMRMDEFEKRAILFEGRTLVDPLQRILLLKEAAAFEAFEMLKVDRELVRFFTKSDALFKFFEELAAEDVSLEILAKADPYAEFDRHLAVLEELQRRYQDLLEAKGMTDRMFVPRTYRLNEGFISGYTRIEIYLEGYLSLFELSLLQRCSEHTQVVIHYHTSRFTRKMQERFATYGVDLPASSRVTFDLGARKILEQEADDTRIHAEVLKVEERDAQIAQALVKIEEMVQSGIDPTEIVLVLPDESFKTHFMLFDYLGNLNFAMGYDYANGRIGRSLEALYRYVKKPEKENRVLPERYGLDMEKIDTLNWRNTINAEAFFALLEILRLREQKRNENIEALEHHFVTLFAHAKLALETWLFMWLKSLSKVSNDDVRGGKVTVMGALETRGVGFRGVVIVDFNEGTVPATPSKDMFLNSTVRAFAKLPTRQDRESLQKQIYNRLLQQAERAVILYATSENRLPSKFLYELGLPEAKQTEAPLYLLYAEPSALIEEHDPIVSGFDASSQTWSASRLKTFLECKRKYYYRYIAKIEAKEDEELNEGAFLHRVLEQLYSQCDHYTDETTLTKALHSILDKLLPRNDAQSRYRKMLWREKLKGFVQKEIDHFRADWRVAAREVEVTGEIGGLKFKGRIDRIDQNATDTLVLDYKSGKVEKEPKKLNPDKVTDFQMSLYHELLKGRYQNISLAYVKILEQGEKQQVGLLEERKALLGEHIVNLKQTTSFVASKCESLQPCQYCEFALMCGRGEYL